MIPKPGNQGKCILTPSRAEAHGKEKEKRVTPKSNVRYSSFVIRCSLSRMCDRRTDETLSVRYGYGAMGDGPAPWKGKRKYEEREKRKKKKKRDLYDLDGPLGPMSVGSCGAVKSVRRSKELTVNDGFPLVVRALASV